MAATDHTEALRAIESSEPTAAPFPAGITETQVRELEEVAASKEVGQKRRMVLVTMASDSEELTRIRDENPEMFAGLVDAAHDYEQHTDAAHDMAKAALARLALIGLKSH